MKTLNISLVVVSSGVPRGVRPPLGAHLLKAVQHVSQYWSGIPW